MTHVLSFQDIQSAHNRISKHVIRTPNLTSTYFNELLGSEILFKAECFQKTASFKARGAHNAVYSLSEKEAGKGVIAHSSGNHGAALSLAARSRGISATIVMPENSAKVKIEAVQRYGGNIVFCQPTMKSREETTHLLVNEKGFNLIHPFDDERVIAGQGTVAIELLEDEPNLDAILAPFGGGGLMSGVAIASKSVKSDITVVAVEPAGADDAYQSWKSGQICKVEKPQTIADGLRGQIGKLPFDITHKRVDEFFTVSESEIIAAMKLIWRELKITIEPSSAVTVAGLIQNKFLFKGKKLGVILTGGNVDLDDIPWMLGR